MTSRSRRTSTVLLLVVALLAASGPSGAITAELARKCSALMAKEFPPRELGNPAAGSVRGSGAAQQTYFNRCVANNGKVDEKADK